MNLTAVFDQYLRHADLPVLELEFRSQGLAKGGKVAYRWQAHETAFAMPVRVGRAGEWLKIHPTREWQELGTELGKDDFAVATELYYVKVKR